MFPRPSASAPGCDRCERHMQMHARAGRPNSCADYCYFSCRQQAMGVQFSAEDLACRCVVSRKFTFASSLLLAIGFVASAPAWAFSVVTVQAQDDTAPLLTHPGSSSQSLAAQSQPPGISIGGGKLFLGITNTPSSSSPWFPGRGFNDGGSSNSGLLDPWFSGHGVPDPEYAPSSGPASSYAPFGPAPLWAR
jgi:hypothetical protein